MLVRQPKTVGPDFIFDEDPPFIATGPFKLVAHKDGAPDGVETEQLHTRLQYSLFLKRCPEGGLSTPRLELCTPGCLPGWLAGWLTGWLAGWLAG